MYFIGILADFKANPVLLSYHLRLSLIDSMLLYFHVLPQHWWIITLTGSSSELLSSLNKLHVSKCDQCRWFVFLH